jgi:hypothetical protein
MELFEDRASDVSPQASPLRVLLRLALALVIAIPACLVLVIFLAFQAGKRLSP